MSTEIIHPYDIIKMSKYEVWIKKPILLPIRYANFYLVHKGRFFNRQQLVENGFRLGDLPGLVTRFGGVDLPVINP
jgi:hypothetical protein